MLIRYLVKLVTFVSFAVSASFVPALAQSSGPLMSVPYGTPQINPVTTLPPLAIPAAACPPLPMGLSGDVGGWNYCNSIQQWIKLYNDGVKIQNELAEIRANVQRFATYPQKLSSNVSGDLAQLATIADEVNGLSISTSKASAQMSQVFPGFTAGTEYSSYMTKLRGSTTTSIQNALAQSGLDMSTMQRDANIADQVKAAAASATSPTQAVQALAQLDSVLIEQMQKQQRMSGAALNASSAYYLAQTNKDSAAAVAQAQAVQQWATFAAPTLPTLTVAQARAIAGLSP